MCLRGLSDFAESELSQYLGDERIQIVVIFVPMLGAEEKDVRPAMRYLHGPNVHYFWTPTRVVMEAFGASIETDKALWDFWGIYEGKWSGLHPPTPVFWQHQLPDLPVDKRLDVESFIDVMRERLNSR